MTKARRPGLIVATALKRKYGELKGRDAYLFADHAAIRADMAHVGAVLAMFDPGADLAAIPARRPKKPNGGRWTRTALGILKRANRPLKAYELARLVMSELGVPPRPRDAVLNRMRLAVVARAAGGAGLGAVGRETATMGRAAGLGACSVGLKGWRVA